MSLQLFQFQLQEMEIDEDQLAQLMGYPLGAIPDEIRHIIRAEIELFPTNKEIQGGYALFPCRMDYEQNTIGIGNQEFFPGKKLMHLMKASTQMAVYTCTAGRYISERARSLMASGLLLEGYIVDVLGSTLVEAAMDRIQQSLSDEVHRIGLSATNRYSPGYCDWMVVEQKSLFALLPKGFCGIALSESALMEPIKSVSGFIGIGVGVKKHAHTCDQCTATQCIYRYKKPEERTAPSE